MSGELIVPIVMTSRRWHLHAEDAEGGIASVEVMLAGGELRVHVTCDDDRCPIVFRVKPA